MPDDRAGRGETCGVSIKIEGRGLRGAERVHHGGATSVGDEGVHPGVGVLRRRKSGTEPHGI